MIDLSIIIPCYNEEKNIPLIVKAYKKAIKNNKDSIELVLVNNGSTDGSQKAINEQVKKHKDVSFASVKNNIGYGHGIMTGLNDAKGEFLAWTHADLQTDIKDVIKGYKIIKKSKFPKKTIVKGNRKNRKLIENIFSFGMGIVETMIFQKNMYEINAQPNIFNRSLMKRIKNPPMDFSLDLYFYYIAKLNNYTLKRFYVVFPPRIHGSSNWNLNFFSKFKFISNTLIYSIKLRFAKNK